MKKIFIFFLLTLVISSCKESNTKEERIIPSSNGRINSVSVVIDNELWKGPVGDTIRKHLAQPVLGLPQDEPIFSLSHIPSQAFEGFVRNNRTFVQVIKGEKQDFGFVQDAFAEPQLGVIIKGKNNQEIIEVFTKNAAKIIDHIKRVELIENQKRISESQLDTQRIQEQLGINLNIPENYRYAKTKNNFLWIRRNIKSGHMNLLVYELPRNAINKDSILNSEIVKARDSISKHFLEGEEEESHYKTEGAFTPFLIETVVGGHQAYETRGTWEITKQFMGGPYLNYMIEDRENNRYIVLEGFTYAPRLEKRNYMFELEAIMKTVKIN